MVTIVTGYLKSKLYTGFIFKKSLDNLDKNNEKATIFSIINS